MRIIAVYKYVVSHPRDQILLEALLTAGLQVFGLGIGIGLNLFVGVSKIVLMDDGHRLPFVLQNWEPDRWGLQVKAFWEM